MKNTQCQRIVTYMKQFGSISTLQSFVDLVVARLASRIHELKRMGYKINSEMKQDRNRWGEITSFKVYSLVEDTEDG